MKVKVVVYNDVKKRSGSKDGNPWSFINQDAELVTPEGSRNVNFALSHASDSDILPFGKYEFDVVFSVDKFASLICSVSNPVQLK